jgi:hypothetical protein
MASLLAAAGPACGGAEAQTRGATEEGGADAIVQDVNAPDSSTSDGSAVDSGIVDATVEDASSLDSAAADSRGAEGGGADSGSRGDGGSVTFTHVYTTILAPNCLPCHSPGPEDGFNIGKLDMSQQGATYTNLVGLTGTGVAAMGVGPGSSGILCSSVTGLLLVEPGSAMSSLLWEGVNARLTGAMPPCGSPMPTDGGALTQAQVSDIGTWIDQGALNN